MAQTEDDITLHVARETVEELLDKMKVKASVEFTLESRMMQRAKPPYAWISMAKI